MAAKKVIEIIILHITREQVHDGKYIGESVEDWPHDIELAADLGLVHFASSIRARGHVRANQGTGIVVNHDIKVGCGVEVGLGIEAGGTIEAGWGIEAREGIKARLDIVANFKIEAGKSVRAVLGSIHTHHSINAGNDIKAGEDITTRNGSIKAGKGIIAGGDIKSGDGIEAGSYIKAGESVAAGKGIEACRWVRAGRSISAGKFVRAGLEIEAGKNIGAGARIEAGNGIRAGLWIVARSIRCPLRISAGLSAEDGLPPAGNAICGKILQGKIAHGVLAVAFEAGTDRFGERFIGIKVGDEVRVVVGDDNNHSLEQAFTVWAKGTYRPVLLERRALLEKIATHFIVSEIAIAE